MKSKKNGTHAHNEKTDGLHRGAESKPSHTRIISIVCNSCINRAYDHILVRITYILCFLFFITGHFWYPSSYKFKQNIKKN